MAMDLERICRLCLEANEQTFNIFTNFYWKRNIFLYMEMLSYCTKLKPFQEDGLPKLICRECVKQLKKTYAFNVKCEASDKKLRQYLENLSKQRESEIQIEVDIKNELENAKGDQIKDEIEEIKDHVKNTVEIELNDAEKKVFELLDQDALDNFKDGIKLEPNCNDEGNDSFWEADDNMLLEEIKLTKMHDELQMNGEQPKKKRGRKKRVFVEGELPPVPLSKTPHQCDVCGKVLSTKSNLKAHKICHTDLRPYKCADCPASFRGHSALFQHKKVHTGDTPFHCEYCAKRFSRRSGLVNHIRMHTGEKHFSCDICFKNFVQRAQLSIHMKRHKGDKPYLCQECGKGFPIKADLKVHQRVHNGDKPYSCHLCTKTFATSGNLSIHIRIHKKDIRYKCSECHRGFVTTSAYNVHLKRHKGQRDYHCECGKTFYTSSALKQHKVVHTGEKKYQCKICERKFTQTSHLSRHFKRDHSKPNVPLPPSEHYKIVLEDTQDGRFFKFIDSAIKKLDMNPDVKCKES